MMADGDDVMTVIPSVTDQVLSPAKSGSKSEGPKKRHLNVVFIGDVDAGKSTIGSQIIAFNTLLEEYLIRKHVKEDNYSWYAYTMGTRVDRRIEGYTDGFKIAQTSSYSLDAPGCRTTEVRRAHYETPTRRFTFLDTPGHIGYVRIMISGASQADIGVLVISAQKGEFERGYEKGGQIREHVQLAKSMGVTKLVVAVNKMDDFTVNWSIGRYHEIESKVTSLLKSSGYFVKQDVQFLPISGLQPSNLLTRVSRNVCSWWTGVCLLEALDSVDVPPRDPEAPFRLPIIDKFRSLGTVVMGKSESGSVSKGDTLMIMPTKAVVDVLAIYCDEDAVEHAGPGENLRVRLSGIEEEVILPGFILCSVAKLIPVVTSFVAEVQFLETPNNAIYTAGYKAVLHIHSVVEDCEIVELMKQIDLKTKKPLKKKVMYAKSGYIVLCRIQVSNLTCIEKFTNFPQLGRFTLRSEGKTAAIREVIELA